MAQKILEPFLDLCVSSLREGHANLLCIVPILTDVAEATEASLSLGNYKPKTTRQDARYGFVK